MNTLLFDAGNSRLKWALARDGRLGVMQAVERADTAGLQRWLSRQRPVDRVAGVCVAGAAYERRLRSLLRLTGHPSPAFVRSTESAVGLRNGYDNPRLLGHDRWAAAAAAWHLAGCSRAVCAVSLGTALTIDVVDKDGQHRGGLIAPGPALMLESLLGKTHGIAARARAAGRRRRGSREALPILHPLASNTRDAIYHGSLLATAGAVDRIISQLARELGRRPVVFVSGGAAAAVMPLLTISCKSCPDLVLRGVAVIAGVPISGRP